MALEKHESFNVILSFSLETVYDVMRSLGFDENRCTREIVGCSVLTRYNNNHYRVDDIDWDMKPLHAFVNSRGERQTFLEYYQTKYGISHINTEQPLLIHRLKVS